MEKISREERRKQKDLDEARKAGNAPAEVDEEGKFEHVVAVACMHVDSCYHLETSTRTSPST